jgi:hypothetical protein
MIMIAFFSRSIHFSPRNVTYPSEYSVVECQWPALDQDWAWYLAGGKTRGIFSANYVLRTPEQKSVL